MTFSNLEDTSGSTDGDALMVEDMPLLERATATGDTSDQNWPQWQRV
jgi:hypothetical protein